MIDTQTDLLARWRALGWIPPSEQPEVQKKWKDVAENTHWPFRKPEEAEAHG
jgi:hypothetical protein